MKVPPLEQLNMLLINVKSQIEIAQIHSRPVCIRINLWLNTFMN